MREFAFVIEPSRLNGVHSAFCLPFCLTIFGDFSNVRPIRFHQDEKSHGHLLYTLVVLLSFLLYRLRFTRLEHADFERLLKESRFRWLKLVELKLAWSILFRYLNCWLNCYFFLFTSRKGECAIQSFDIWRRLENLCIGSKARVF